MMQMDMMTSATDLVWHGEQVAESAARAWHKLFDHAIANDMAAEFGKCLKIYGMDAEARHYLGAERMTQLGLS